MKEAISNTKKFQLNSLIEKSVSEDDRFTRIKGVASTGKKDRHGDVIFPDQWGAKALKEFKKNPVLLYAHNHSEIIGKAFNLTVTDTGLEFEADVSKKWDKHYLLEDELLKGVSVGFMGEGWAYDQEAEHWTVKSVELLEISLVAVQANTDATFTLAKSFENESDYEQFKKEHTIQKSDMNILESIKGLLTKKASGELTEKEAKELQDLITENKETIKSMLGEDAEEVTDESTEATEATETTEEATEDAPAEKSALEKALDEISVLKSKVDTLTREKSAKESGKSGEGKDGDPSPTEKGEENVWDVRAKEFNQNFKEKHWL